jgi:hypothetical protein
MSFQKMFISQNILPHNLQLYKTSNLQKVLHYKTSSATKHSPVQNVQPIKRPLLHNVFQYKMSSSTKHPITLFVYYIFNNQDASCVFDHSQPHSYFIVSSRNIILVYKNEHFFINLTNIPFESQYNIIIFDNDKVNHCNDTRNYKVS